MNAAANVTPGSTIRNARAFVTPIGCTFAAGTTFTVIMVGSVNVRVQDQHGSQAWIQVASIKGSAEQVDRCTAGFYLA